MQHFALNWDSRKKRKGVAVLFAAILLIAVTISLVVFRTKSYSIELPVTKVLLAELPKENIYIYGNSLRENSGIYNGLYLSINGINKYYDWKSMTYSFAPELILKDMNGDEKNELVIILTMGEGTGVRDSDVHVINPENFKETEVVNPLSIINEHVDSSIVHSNGIVTISVSVNGQTSVITLNEDYSKAWVKDKVEFGRIVKYSVDGSKLKATVPAQVSIAGFVGDINIVYAFKDNKFVMDNIKFLPYKNY